MDTLHVAISREVETCAVELDRSARATLLDDQLGHRVYVLDEPLQPGESLRLQWEVRYAPRGFPARGISTAIVGNGSFFMMRDWMPLIGYQVDRELVDALERSERGLPAQAVVAPLYDVEARSDRYGMEHVDLVATVSTSADQIALSRGDLVRTWTEEGRRYFRYETARPSGTGTASSPPTTRWDVGAGWGRHRSPPSSCARHERAARDPGNGGVARAAHGAIRAVSVPRDPDGGVPFGGRLAARRIRHHLVSGAVLPVRLRPRPTPDRHAFRCGGARGSPSVPACAGPHGRRVLLSESFRGTPPWA